MTTFLFFVFCGSRWVGHRPTTGRSKVVRDKDGEGEVLTPDSPRKGRGGER